MGIKIDEKIQQVAWKSNLKTRRKRWKIKTKLDQSRSSNAKNAKNIRKRTVNGEEINEKYKKISQNLRTQFQIKGLRDKETILKTFGNGGIIRYLNSNNE